MKPVGSEMRSHGMGVKGACLVEQSTHVPSFTHFKFFFVKTSLYLIIVCVSKPSCWCYCVATASRIFQKLKEPLISNVKKLLSIGYCGNQSKQLAKFSPLCKTCHSLPQSLFQLTVLGTLNTPGKKKRLERVSLVDIQTFILQPGPLCMDLYITIYKLDFQYDHIISSHRHHNFHSQHESLKNHYIT